MDERAGWRELSPADLDVVAEAGGSVAAALAWVEMVLDGRIAESWPVTGPGFRLHLARPAPLASLPVGARVRGLPSGAWFGYTPVGVFTPDAPPTRWGFPCLF